MTDASAVIVFARLPVPGKVKTRLAKGIGAERAATFYKQCAEHVLRQASHSKATTQYVFFSVAEEEEGVRKWMQEAGLNDTKLRPQCKSPDLGDRMREALKIAFDEGAKRALIIGTDIPGLRTDIIDTALQALEKEQLVYGPAVDGGYYLVGMDKLRPEVFSGVEWSTETVLSRSLEIAKEHSIQAAPTSLLPTLPDMDLREDLQGWFDTAPEDHPLREIAATSLS